MDVTIPYLNLQDNDVQIAQCDGTPSPKLQPRSRMARCSQSRSKVRSRRMTPVLAMFDNSIDFDYTAKRAIAESAYYTDKWPVGPPVAGELHMPNRIATTGRVYFSWDPLTIGRTGSRSGIRIPIRRCQPIDHPDTQYAYCNDDDPSPGVVCGADIDPNGGSGMWYMVVIQRWPGRHDLTRMTRRTASHAGGGWPWQRHGHHQRRCLL